MAVVLFKWLSISILSLFHPFHVSVTEINHNAKEQTLEISCKLFVDDFEKGLFEFGKTKVDLQSAVLHEKMNLLIKAYFNKNLNIKIDGKEVDREFIGFEVEKESVFCYYQITKISSIKKLDIFSTILYDEFDDQSNIFHVTVNGKRQSTKIELPGSAMTMSF